MSELFEIGQLLDLHAARQRPYLEFFRIPAMSAGIYVLPAGGTDSQRPHREDEIYYVVRGKAKMRFGSEEREVKQGDMIFVEPGLDHRFFEILEELVLLVVFAPSETI